MAIPADGLKLNLRADTLDLADGAAVDTWGGFPAAGNATRPKMAHNATPAGTKAVRFASEVSIDLGNLLSGVTGAEAFVVLKNATIDHMSLWDWGTSTDLSHYPFSGEVYDDFGGAGRSGPAPKAAGVAFNEWHIYNVSRGQEGGDPVGTFRRRLRQGDVDTALTDLTFTAPTSDAVVSFTTSMQLGRTANASWYYTGDIAACVVYTRILTATERTQVYDDLVAAHLAAPAPPPTTVTSSSAVGAAPALTRSAVATVVSPSGISASPTTQQVAAVVLTSTSALAASPSVTQPVAVALLSPSVVHAAPTVQHAAASSTTSASAIGATATVQRTATATVSSGSVVSGMTVQAVAGTSAVSSASAIAAGGVREAPSAALVASLSAVAGGGTILQPAAASIASASTLTVVSTVALRAAAVVQSMSALTALGEVIPLFVFTPTPSERTYRIVAENRTTTVPADTRRMDVTR